MKRISKNNLDQLVFFNKLDSNEIAYIYPYIEENKYKKDEVILEQGAQGGDLYLIISGTVSISVILPGDYKMDVATLSPGQVFGEVTFLSNSHATASVVAQQSCKCFVIYHKLLQMLRIANPQIAFKLEQEIANQTARKISSNIHSILNLMKGIPDEFLIHSEHALYLENVAAYSKILDPDSLNSKHLSHLSFFAELTKEQCLYLLSLMTIKSYEKGYRFLDKMEKPLQKIGLLYSGAVMFFMKENNQLKKSLAVIKVGEIFLQNFIFADFCEVADYVAYEDSIVLELDIQEYQKLRHSHPAIFYTISKAMNREIAKSVYIVNRQFVRISSEYYTLIGSEIK